MTRTARAELAEAIKQSAKYKALYERTGKDEHLDAYVKWDRERARLFRMLQESLYEAHKAQAGVR
jgi:uncharacterized protein YukE